MKPFGSPARLRLIAVAAGALVLAQMAGAVAIAQASGGTVWTLRSAPDAYWGGVTFAEGTFVAVGGAPNVLTSPDGVTWTSNAAPSGNWASVVHAQDQFVAVAANSVAGNLAMTSPDGMTWTAQPGLNVPTNWNSVTYGDDTYVASGDQWMAYSTDGISWTEAEYFAGQYHSWKSVAFADDTFVVVNSAAGAVNRVMTSNDGVTWTPRNAGIQVNEWTGVAYGAGVFVAVAGTGTDRVMTSPDGVTWTPRSAASANYWTAVTYGGGQFVAVAFGGAVMTSPDGITWTSQSSGNTALWRSVAAGPQYVAVGQSSGQPVMSSFIDPAPTVSSVSPSTSPTSGGGSITVTGTGFIAGASVSIGGAPCTSPAVVSGTTLTCVVPPGSAGPQDVSVTNPDSQTATLPNGLEYTNPPPPPPPVVFYPPGPPLNVTASPGDASAEVSWSPPLSPGTFAVTAYRVISSPGGHGCTTSGLSCVVTELSNGTAYTFTVSAESAVGWGSASVPSESVTPVEPTPPPAPSITIVGSRAEVRGRPGISIAGTSTELGMGAQLVPFLRFAGDSAFARGSTRIAVDASGEFMWSRTTRRAVTVYVQTVDGSVTSNEVRIAVRQKPRLR